MLPILGFLEEPLIQLESENNAQAHFHLTLQVVAGKQLVS